VQEDGAYHVNAKTGALSASTRLARDWTRSRRDYIKVLAMPGLRIAVAVPELKQEPTLKEILND
jgi:hypothetical protein